jgi:hypothetical protein
MTASLVKGCASGCSIIRATKFGIFLEGLRKTLQTLRQNSWCTSWDWDWNLQNMKHTCWHNCDISFQSVETVTCFLFLFSREPPTVSMCHTLYFTCTTSLEKLNIWMKIVVDMYVLYTRMNDISDSNTSEVLHTLWRKARAVALPALAPWFKASTSGEEISRVTPAA